MSMMKEKKQKNEEATSYTQRHKSEEQFSEIQEINCCRTEKQNSQAF